MDPETERRIEGVEFRLTEAEEKIVSQDATLSAIKKLILRGMRLLAETDEGLKALNDAQKSLIDAQIATEDKLQRLLESKTNGHS